MKDYDFNSSLAQLAHLKELYELLQPQKATARCLIFPESPAKGMQANDNAFPDEDGRLVHQASRTAVKLGLPKERLLAKETVRYNACPWMSPKDRHNQSVAVAKLRFELIVRELTELETIVIFGVYARAGSKDAWPGLHKVKPYGRRRVGGFNHPRWYDCASHNDRAQFAETISELFLAT